MRQGSSTGSRTMVQRHGIARDLTVCGLFTALTAVGAFIKIVIPVGADTMNFTLQWFFVLLAGLLLGSRRAFLSVSTYLLIGLMGIPVFARGGGPAYLVRPTFGFLLGFAGAAYTTGTLSERLHRHTFLNLLAAAFAGMMVMYLSGMLYFYFISNYVISMPVTWGIVLVNCFLLTVGGDFLLCVLASALAVRLLPILQKIR